MTHTRPLWLLAALASVRCAGDVTAGAGVHDTSTTDVTPSITTGDDAAASSATHKPSDDTSDIADSTGSVGAPFGGPAACADVFRAPDGSCAPRVDVCPAGTYPHVRTGCQPAGISPCPPEFVNPDGACVPSVAQCPADTIPVPSRGCLTVATERDFEARSANALYVRAGGGIHQDGSRAHPYGTIAAAVAAAPSGATIFVGPGVWNEHVRLSGNVSLVGAGADLTTLVPPEGDAIELDSGSAVTIARLTIQGGHIGVVAHHSRVRLAGVRITSASSDGVSAHRSEVTLTRCLIQNTGRKGIVATGGTLTVESSAVVDAGGTGIEVNKATFTATDVHVEVPTSEPTGGLVAISAANWGSDLQTTLRHISVVGGPINVIDGQFGMSDSVIASGTTAKEVDQTWALVLDHSTVAYVSRNLIFEPEGVGIHARNGAAAYLSANVVQGAWSLDHWERRTGGIAVSDATMVSDDDTILACQGKGVAADGATALLDAHGLLIHGTTARTERRDEEYLEGFGLHVDHVAHANVIDSAIIGSANAGVWVTRPSTELLLQRTLVTDGTGMPDGHMGVGASVQLGATATFRDVRFKHNRAAALWVQNTFVTVDHSLFEDTTAGTMTLGDGSPTEGLADGILASRPEKLDISRSRVSRCARAGILLSKTKARSASLATTAVETCDFGLVLENTEATVLGSGNAFLGNRLKDVWTDGILAVPQAPALLPP